MPWLALIWINAAAPRKSDNVLQSQPQEARQRPALPPRARMGAWVMPSITGLFFLLLSLPEARRPPVSVARPDGLFQQFAEA
jgi:hypothetical protein